MISLLFKFDNLADYGAFVEELPWDRIVHDMQAGRQIRSLPLIDWNVSNDVVHHLFTRKSRSFRGFFWRRLNQFGEFATDTPVGWATRTMWANRRYMDSVQFW